MAALVFLTSLPRYCFGGTYTVANIADKKKRERSTRRDNIRNVWPAAVLVTAAGRSFGYFEVALPSIAPQIPQGVTTSRNTGASEYGGSSYKAGLNTLPSMALGVVICTQQVLARCCRRRHGWYIILRFWW